MKIRRYTFFHLNLSYLAVVWDSLRYYSSTPWKIIAQFSKRALCKLFGAIFRRIQFPKDFPQRTNERTTSFKSTFELFICKFHTSITDFQTGTL